MVFVSVVIPTYNRLGQLKQVLSGLGSQTVPFEGYEVLVVSDGARDGTEEYLRQLKTPYDLRIFTQQNQGVAAARNCGINHARGDILLFIDDDVVPTPRLIYEHIKMHAEQGDDVVVVGPMLAPPGYAMSPWVHWELVRLSEQYEDMVSGKWAPTARQFYTGNTSLRRCHLIEIGGFDPVFRRAEDVELAYRLADCGLRFLFNPKAIGYHYAERSFKSWVAAAHAYGRNDVIFTRWKGQTWLLPTVLDEFRTRNVLTRLLTGSCLDRKLLYDASHKFLYILMHLVAFLGLNLPADQVCSAVFNLSYYQGVADELGGRKSFFMQLSGIPASSRQ